MINEPNFMLMISFIRHRKRNRKHEYPIQYKQEIICKLMSHILHKQTWYHPFMWDVQISKPCYQADHIYHVSQPCLMKHVRVKSYPVSHTNHLYQFLSCVILDAQLCSNHRKSQLNAMEKYSSKDQETE